MIRTNICRRCRHIVSPKDKICPYCGNRLTDEKKQKIDAAENPDKRKKTKEQKKPKKRGSLRYVVILAPLILAMSGVCGFYIFSGKQENKPWLSEQPAQTAVPEENKEDTAENEGEQTATEETENPDEQTAPDNEENPGEEGEKEPENEPEIEENTEDSPEVKTAAPSLYTPAPTAPPVRSTPDEHGNTGSIPPKFTSYKASSAAEDVYSAAHAFDGSMDNAWGAGRENNGIGEWIMMSAEDYQAVSGVKIYNGHTQSEQTFNDNARIRIVELSFSDGSYIKRFVQDGFSRTEPQIIRLPERINTKYVKITILDKYGDSDVVCVGEIEVF
ncbi:MAG: discoidin domain-containing protein [Oscillospiraceae bacterium]|nr:discoidin domain-containing protein [Oscillospiraceae bacterium]